MKAIIFDLDNTLIPWKDEYIDKIIEDMGKYNINREDAYKVYELVNVYEDSHAKLDKMDLLNFINSNLDISLDVNLLDDYIDIISNCYYKEKGLDETLAYLSKKYDLYVITNWFTSSQTKRLDNIDILKYFKQVIGADINYYKPDKRTFDVILKKYQPQECVSVGDSLNKDILLPLSLGMKAIWKTDEKDLKYQCIKDISELMNIL